MNPFTSKTRTLLTPNPVLERVNGQLISINIFDEGLDLASDRITVAEIEAWSPAEPLRHCVRLQGKDRSLSQYPGTVSGKTFPVFYLTDAGVSALTSTEHTDGTVSWVLQ
jgi:hypothetical protein